MPTASVSFSTKTGRAACQECLAPRGSPVIAYSAWVAEFLIQLLGATLNWRNSKILSVLLGFLCLSDIAIFFVYQSHREIYWAFSWGQQAGKYLLLIFLGCEICGMFVRQVDRAQTRIMAGFICCASAALITMFAWNGETLKDKLLDAEIAANMILWALVTLGWLSRQKYLNAHWQWIAAGFVTLIGWDLTVTIFWKYFWVARHFYPLGTIAAYVVWIVGPLKGLGEFRRELGKRLEVPKEVHARIM